MVIKFSVRILGIIESTNPDKHHIEKLLIQSNKNRRRIPNTRSLMILEDSKNFYLSNS